MTKPLAPIAGAFNPAAPDDSYGAGVVDAIRRDADAAAGLVKAGPARLRYTVLLCAECVRMLGMNYADQIGGTFIAEPCQFCGKVNFLHEHRTGVSLAAILDDAR